MYYYKQFLLNITKAQFANDCKTKKIKKKYKKDYKKRL